ncbi:MAG: tetratricopeptide repeat protein [Planctomycetota bacterium]
MSQAITLRVRPGEGGDARGGAAQVELLVNGASASSTVSSPWGRAVEGEERLLDGCLAWYLEGYLRDYPTDFDRQRAERITTALEVWGREAFDAILGTGEGAGVYALAGRDPEAEIVFEIRSDDPGLLAWPWEAMTSRSGFRLGQRYPIVRTLEAVEPQVAFDPLSVTGECLEVLLVTARPRGRTDVGYRSISRPLVDYAARIDVPIRVQLLRPPTFAALHHHLEQNSGRYHVLHFDGHGAYMRTKGAGGSDGTGAPIDYSPHTLSAPDGTYSGYLQFEPEPGQDAKEGLIPASRISEVLSRHRIPIVVLNACQSAKIDERASDEFASVAGSLVKAGVRSVVAMSHVLWVTGAQEFVPAFYESLVKSSSVGRAVLGGRRRMLDHPKRECVRGKWELHDWIVPVLFEQNPAQIALTPPAPGDAAPTRGVAQEQMPQEARIADEPFGFIGRDGPIMDLERAMRRKAAVVIQGIGGVGKSILAKGFLEWLADTGGLTLPPLWFGLDTVSSVDYLLNRIGEAFGRADIGALPVRLDPEAEPERAAQLTEFPKVAVLKHLFARLPETVVCVLDNFEVVTDAGAGQATGRFGEADRAALKALIRAAHGTRFRIIITSRTSEDWLGADFREVIPVGGLSREERLRYVSAVVQTKGLGVDRNEEAFEELLEALQGHPLLMRIVLPRLGERMTAQQALDEIKAGLPATLADTGTEDETLAKLRSTIAFATEGVPEELRPLLTLVGLHERYMNSNELLLMAQQVDQWWDKAAIDQFELVLTHAGLTRPLHGITNHGVVLELHPALAGHLHSVWLPALADDERRRWTTAFVDVMALMADAIAGMRVYEQRPYHHFHGPNFRAALEHAERLEMSVHICALAQSLGMYAQNTLSFEDAAGLYQKLIEVHLTCGDEDKAADGYHHLGRVAELCRDFKTAERWYKQSLKSAELLGNEKRAAVTCHHLGMVAQERRDFDAAEGWYKRSLEIEKRRGEEYGAAVTYHQLGRVAEERRDFDIAEDWYKKSLEIKRHLGEERGVLMTCGQLGNLAQLRQNFDAAEKWYRQSLEISQSLGDDEANAKNYHNLGNVARERRKFDSAEESYKRSLEIAERIGDEYSAGITCHQLGMVAEARRDFNVAEGWYRRSLESTERLGDEHSAAATYHELSIVARKRAQFHTSAELELKALEIYTRFNDKHHGRIVFHGLLCTLQAASPNHQAELKAQVVNADLPREMLDQALAALDNEDGSSNDPAAPTGDKP